MLVVFAIFGFLSVALGAFGAHGLAAVLSEKSLSVYHTAVSYQFYHTLALGVVLVFEKLQPHPGWRQAAWFFVVGILVFSGSLYTLALTQIGVFGAITPIGGVSFLLGWLWVAKTALNLRKTS